MNFEVFRLFYEATQVQEQRQHHPMDQFVFYTDVKLRLWNQVYGPRWTAVNSQEGHSLRRAMPTLYGP